jgi:hypothetical protein
LQFTGETERLRQGGGNGIAEENNQFQQISVAHHSHPCMIRDTFAGLDETAPVPRETEERWTGVKHPDYPVHSRFPYMLDM